MLFHSPSSKLPYRADIDGLRAIAITTVLLFHAFPALFPGGFIGVDVFFVISGFLITGNILRDIQSGSFTIGRFYLRRVRRIFPSLILVLVCSLVAGSIILSPTEFKQLGKHAAAATGFVSNLFYWAESGYFDSAAITKPLLHLWSLGIEEQFYFVWPLLVLFSHRKGKGQPIVLVVAVISFIVCVLTTSPLAFGSFFSPVTRFWQLALGGIVAFNDLKKTLPADKTLAGPRDTPPGYSWMAEVGTIIGLVTIVWAVFGLDATTSYPGWRAMLPTLAACLIMAPGNVAFLNRYLLSNPIMVFGGLISYPLYLWHWPILSFAHTVGLGLVSNQLKTELLLSSVVLATGSHLLLERPLHSLRLNWRLGNGLLVLMLCIGLGSGAIYFSAGRSSTQAESIELVAKDLVTPSARPLDAVGGQPENSTSPSTPADFTNILLKDDIVGKPSPDRLVLYRKRIADAMAASSGYAHAYLVSMVSSRLKATRSGVCEYANAAIEWPDTSKDRTICEQPVDGAKNLLIMGDSIASDTYVWVHDAYPQYNVIQATGIGCNLSRFDKDLPKPCIATNKYALDIALSPTVSLEAVILSSLWGHEDLGQTNTEHLIEKLLARGRKVIIIGPPVGFTVPPYELAEKCPSSSINVLTLAEFEKCVKERSNVHREVDELVKHYAERKGLRYLSLHELSCNDEECPVLDTEGQLMFTDTWHRSFPGDHFLAQRIRRNKVLERLIGTL